MYIIYEKNFSYKVERLKRNVKQTVNNIFGNRIDLRYL